MILVLELNDSYNKYKLFMKNKLNQIIKHKIIKSQNKIYSYKSTNNTSIKNKVKYFTSQTKTLNH